MPKVIAILFILIPNYELMEKIVLTLLWLLSLIIDYDIARPSHRGNVYKLTKRLEFNLGELVVACIKFVPGFCFFLATILMKTWISAIPGSIVLLIGLSSIAYSIREVIVEKARKTKTYQGNQQKPHNND